jgi:putative membrane protein
MRVLLAALASLVAAALALPALAANPDEDFLAKAKSSGVLEVRLGDLVSQHGSSPGVRAFAERMAKEHKEANDALEELARRQSLAVPMGMSPEDEAKVGELGGMRGAELDHAYMKLMVAAHEQDVALFRAKSAEGESPVAQWASRTLPMLTAHLEHARRVADELGVAPAPEP